ncbi:hypothetical protein ILUMI_16514 [Ignelater luminosus]|uniref:Uncharacterized protein n=1 Tax=Ignelater luminosus TaxID=2038154 RepID=A0A8K0CLL9_IGNLU|nr:hypothetical protein ILUMI_16514 [Ignelater luminosus]
MVHSRWLTSANRILRPYVSTFNPSENLQLLVNYVVKVYAPIWFLIKQNTSLKDEPKHIFQLIMYSRSLPKNLRSVVDSVIEINAFFAHPENLLASMLFDDREHILELALQRIIKAREAESSTKRRIFKPPKINFSARDYTEIIVWQECQVTPPPGWVSVTARGRDDGKMERTLFMDLLGAMDTAHETESLVTFDRVPKSFSERELDTALKKTVSSEMVNLEEIEEEARENLVLSDSEHFGRKDAINAVYPLGKLRKLHKCKHSVVRFSRVGDNISVKEA